MALADNEQLFTDIDNVLRKVYNMANPEMFLRLGKTIQWLPNIRQQKMRGESLNFFAMTAPSSGSRMTTFASGRAGEFPIARDLKQQKMSVTINDLRELQGSVKINALDADRTTKSPADAAADLALTVVGQLEGDFGSQLNAKVHVGGNSAICLVKGIYDADGTTFSLSSAHTPAFIQISDGAISAINRGDVLSIWEAASTGGSDVQNARVLVHDVYKAGTGPPVDGTGVANLGPGIMVEPCDADGTLAAANWAGATVSGDGAVSFTSAQPAVGDYIARSEEFATDAGTGTSYKNIHGFPDVFDSTVDIWRDGDGTKLDREAVGNSWLNPHVFRIAAAGSEVTFDIEDHFRDAEDYLADSVQLGRVWRKNTAANGSSGNNKGLSIGESLVALARPDLINEATRDANGTNLFTRTMSMSLDDAKSKKLFGIVGWDGVVYHSATLGTIALNADVAAKPYQVSVIEPSSFFWVTFGGDPFKIEWLMNGSSRWFPMTGDTNGTLTHYKQGGAYTHVCLMCDQPQANFLVTGVQSSNEA